jgi:hypothetical protein
MSVLTRANLFILEQLEERIVLDASVDNTEASPAPVKILVVSPEIYDHVDLAQAAQPNVIVVSNPEGVQAALTEITLNQTKIDSIAIATHTQDQIFDLNNSEVVKMWESVGGILSDQGRLDLLACGIADTDTDEMIANLIGHEVASSDDKTGNAVFGGDWILESMGINLVQEYFVSEKLDDFQGTLDYVWYKLMPTDGRLGDQFGYGVAIQGDTAVIGGMEQNVPGVGNAYVFKLGGGGWSEEQKIVPDYKYLSSYGISTAGDGDVVAVGTIYTTYNYSTRYQYYPAGYAYAPGSVHIFEDNGTDWEP